MVNWSSDEYVTRRRRPSSCFQNVLSVREPQYKVLYLRYERFFPKIIRVINILIETLLTKSKKNAVVFDSAVPRAPVRHLPSAVSSTRE